MLVVDFSLWDVLFVRLEQSEKLLNSNVLVSNRAFSKLIYSDFLEEPNQKQERCVRFNFFLDGLNVYNELRIKKFDGADELQKRLLPFDLKRVLTEKCEHVNGAVISLKLWLQVIDFLDGVVVASDPLKHVLDEMMVKVDLFL